MEIKRNLWMAVVIINLNHPHPVDATTACFAIVSRQEQQKDTQRVGLFPRTSWPEDEAWLLDQTGPG